jgi:hypothetical protein
MKKEEETGEKAERKRERERERETLPAYGQLDGQAGSVVDAE